MNDPSSPTVSVVIPAYGHADLILQTLESVFAQTWQDYEVIVINDASPDDTAQRLRAYSNFARVCYVEQSNAGCAAARNRGIALARGEFIALLDDDDLWPPDKLEWQVEALRAQPEAALVYGFMETIGAEEGRIVPENENAPSGWALSAFSRRCWIRSPGQTLLRASALRDLGGFDTTLWGSDDWDLYLRLAARSPFLYRHQRALYYRLHASNASRDGWRMYVNSRRVHRRHLGLLPRPGRVGDWLKSLNYVLTYTSMECLLAAQKFREAGDWRGAYAMWGRAIRIKPWLLCHRTVLREMLKPLPSLLRRRLSARRRG